MKPKHQRLVLGLLALGAVAGAAGLALSALQDQAAFFYAPGDVAGKALPLGKAVRLGGMVETGSLVHKPDAHTSLYGSYVEGLEPGARVALPDDEKKRVYVVTTAGALPGLSISWV